MPTPAEQSRAKVRRHRDNLRAQGLRPVQLWVPDTRTAAFREAARKEALAIAGSEHEADDQAFIDAISEGA